MRPGDLPGDPRAAQDDRGTASALFESSPHVGGAITVAVCLTMLGAGLGDGSAMLLGAVITGVGGLATLAVLPRRDR
ncbi:hypothetical protein ACFPOI_28655 [Nonomuraea angiospora]|uniref:Sugar phosphate permease n=1 Tax=Nonomuraea angiospora TaxID=46172 RepID=A0ABR9LTR6_9ACTN|nr:hypothetical protein [Nonomuraea angiospora]MBE1584041.1 sugar phosphate permease [Nonomuraea angiospora]